MTLTKKDSSRIQGTVMKLLRCMHEKTRRDRIQNTEVREILNLDKIQAETEDSEIRSYGHVKRMNTGRIPIQALQYRLRGERP